MQSDPGQSESIHTAEGFLVLVPVLDDWESARGLAQWLGRVARSSGESFEVVFIDDGGQSEVPADLASGDAASLAGVRVLRLLRNLGHQRAIAIGLAWASEHARHQAVVVMDGDGEDKPDDLPAMLQEGRRHHWTRVVFAARTRRSEGLAFRAGYLTFRVLHWLLTSKGVRQGNFSVVPMALVDRLAVTSEVWNHYAAAITKSRLPFVYVPTVRGKRLAGKSKMNLPALVTHGLSALSVHGELVATRLLIVTMLTSGIALLIMAWLVVEKLITKTAITGWTSQLGSLGIVLLVQAITMSVVVSAVALMSRTGATFIPRRDYHWFVAGIRKIDPAG